MEMNMNVVIMCDWECTADGCQDNMGASHPSRLVDEQEKSAESQWCIECTGGAGRDEHFCLLPQIASVSPLLQPLVLSRMSVTGVCSLSVDVAGGGAVFRSTVSHNSLSLNNLMWLTSSRPLLLSILCCHVILYILNLNVKIYFFTAFTAQCAYDLRLEGEIDLFVRVIFTLFAFQY